MKIRRHCESDYHAIAELRWLLKTDDTLMHSDQDKQDFIDRYVMHLQDRDSDTRTVHWLVGEGDSVAGVMTIRIVEKELSPGRSGGCWGYLTNCVVVPEMRNRGLGTKLLQTIKSWATAGDLELLIVWPSEASYRFYRRAGFEGRDDPLQLVLNPDDD